MDLLQRVVALFADAHDRALCFVPLRLQPSYGFPGTLAVFCQLLHGAFQLGALGQVERGASAF